MKDQMKKTNGIRALSIMILLSLLLTSLLTGCYQTKTNSIVGAKINDSGELVIEYSNGNEENLGAVVGEKGQDGKDGVNGIDGTDGKDGINGEDGKDGENGTEPDTNTQVTINSAEGSVALAAAKGLRSVVRVYCYFTRTVQGGYFPGFGSTPTTQEYASQGAGIIYELDKDSGDALIITNYHVVYNVSSDTDNGISDNISLFIYGGETTSKAIPAEYVGGSMYYDIAVLRISGSEILKNSDATAAEIRSSETVSVGQTAIAVGNPDGKGISVSSGIVSKDSEYITVTAPDNSANLSIRVIRVDTAINQGNSGGGLFNTDGELIGIVNARASDSDIENIGFAIPSDTAIAVAESILDNCLDKDLDTLQKANIGITVGAADISAIYDTDTGKISIEEQVCISDVDVNSISYEKLMKNDIVLSMKINDREVTITRKHHVLDTLLYARSGDTVTFVINRDGDIMNVDIALTDDDIISY